MQSMKTVYFKIKQITTPLFTDSLKGILYLHIEIGPTSYESRLFSDEFEANIFKVFTNISFNYDKSNDHQFKILLIFEKIDSSRINLASFNIPLRFCPRNKVVSTNAAMIPCDSIHFAKQEPKDSLNSDEEDEFDYDCNGYDIFFEIHRSEDGSKPFQANLGTLKTRNFVSPYSISSYSELIHQHSSFDSQNSNNHIQQVENAEVTKEQTDNSNEIPQNESINQMINETKADSQTAEINPTNEIEKEVNEIDNKEENEELKSSENIEQQTNIESTPINPIENESIHENDNKEEIESIDINEKTEQIIQFIDSTESSDCDDDIPRIEPINESNSNQTLNITSNLLENHKHNENTLEEEEEDDDNESIPSYENRQVFSKSHNTSTHNNITIELNQQNSPNNTFIEPPFSVHQAENPYQNEYRTNPIDQQKPQQPQSYGYGIPPFNNNTAIQNNTFMGYPTIQQLYSFTAPNIPPA